IVSRAVLLPEEIVELRDCKNKMGNMAVREIVMSEYTRPFVANKIIWFEEEEFKKRVDIAKENPVEMPVLFDEEMRNQILEQAKIYSDDINMFSDVMTKPDLETHDLEDVSE
ncbi:type IV secretory system conjugative DNA transfer family protein, partial [Escherichia coli]|nr:type IV secretory system conjugative DNA transfer family protein [Escherichia coli]